MKINEYLEDSVYEISNEKSKTTFLHIIKRTLTNERRLRKVTSFKLKQADFLFILLTPNHTKFWCQIEPEVDSSISIGDISITKDGIIPINSFYSLSDIIVSRIYKLVYALWFLPFDTKLSKNIERNLAYYYLLNKTIVNIVRKCGVSKVIMFKAESFQARSIARGIKKTNAETIAIQHGLIPMRSKQFNNLNIDKYIVWGESFRKRLELNRANCKIEIGGNLKVDHLFGKFRSEKTNSKVLAMPNSGSSHTSIEDVFLLVDGVLNSAITNQKLQYTIKPHPADYNDNVISYLESQRFIPSNLTIMNRTDEINFFDYGILIINNSAAGLESAILKIPQIVVTKRSESNLVRQYIDYGCGEWANSVITISEKLNLIINNYSKYQIACKELVDDFIGFQGNALDRVKELINDKKI